MDNETYENLFVVFLMLMMLAQFGVILLLGVLVASFVGLTGFCWILFVVSFYLILSTIYKFYLFEGGYNDLFQK